MGRFLLLRVVSLVFMLLAVVVFSFTIYIFLVIDLNAEQLIDVLNLDESWRGVSTLVAMRELVAGVISSISLFAVGLLINLMISIEANTRNTALLLERMATRRRTAPRPSAPPMPNLNTESFGNTRRLNLAPVAPQWDEIKSRPPEPERDSGYDQRLAQRYRYVRRRS